MDILKEFLGSSTIHGLAYISNISSKTGKALWLTMVIAGFCTAGFLISSSYEEWEETPIDTSISTHPIATLPLPIITICPPEQSNTALNVDLVRAGNISLTDADRQVLINVSRQLFIHEPSQNFVGVARKLTNEEAIPQLTAQTRSYPTPYENRELGDNQGFEIWSTELAGSYKSPGFESKRNCSKKYPNVHFTLYIPQNVVINETYNIDIVALSDDEFEVEYREGDKYIFHGKSRSSHEVKSWSNAEKHCNEQNGHLVSIRTNYDFNLFGSYQQRYNKKRNNVWLGGSDGKVESVWEWSDGTPWSNKSAAICSDVHNIEYHGLKACTNWATQQPGGGREENCLMVEQSQKWKSYDCDFKRLPFWCHIPNRRLSGTKKLSKRLSEIKFSKIELQFTKKTEGRESNCNDSRQMPGFSMTWSTTNANGGSNMNQVPTLPDMPGDGELDYYKKKQIKSLSSYLTNLKYKILSCKKRNMTIEEMWNMVKIHKRELIEGSNIGCYLGQVKRDDYRKLFSDLSEKMGISKNPPHVIYKETADDTTLAFEMVSYLLFCEGEQIEMAAFYNNLFRTANPRTILQATVNNIQAGVEEADTMVALHQIYKILAKKMDLNLPYILERFFNSEMLKRIDQNGGIFMDKLLKDDLKPMEMLNQGKT